MIDLEAIRRRALAEKKGATLTLAIVGADTDAGIEAKRVLGAVVDIEAIIAEVERLRKPVGITVMCSIHGPVDRACECLKTLKAIHLGERVAAWEAE